LESKLAPKANRQATDRITWDDEYSKNRVIPSSTREAPSHVLMLYSELLGFSRMETALDAGCGNGRNSIFLAKKGINVNALDFSKTALEIAHQRVKREGLAGKVTLSEHNLGRPLPFDRDSFDLCLDLYVSCHFLDRDMRSGYANELFRMTKRGGYMITAAFDYRDEYYATIAATRTSVSYVTDPKNSVTKELFDDEGLKSVFCPPFSVSYYAELRFSDVVGNRSYERRILSFALQKS